MKMSGNNKKRPRQATKQEQHLQELLFGKNILEDAATTPKITEEDTEIEQNKEIVAVWQDEEETTFDLKKSDRLKKLKKMRNLENDEVNGETFSSLLKERFQQRKVEWAETVQTNEDDNLALLTTSSPFVSGSNSLLSSRHLTMIRQIDANVDSPSNKEINCVRFHPNGNLLLVGGEDKALKFFRIDGEKNETQLTVRFNDMAIRVAEFVGDPTEGDVVVAGRRPHFYSYNTVTGTTQKIPGLLRRNILSHELMAVSPAAPSCPGYIAIGGRSGYIHLLSSKTKTWVTDVKMSSDQHVTALCWWDEQVLCGAAGGGNICFWDIRMSGSGGRVLASFRHDEGSYISSLATNRYHVSQERSPGQKYLAVGGESGVVSVYDMLSNSSFEMNDPLKLKDVMNLTTRVSSMSLHPSGQLLAIGSDQKKDQLRMIHLPTCSAYSNWPTSRTPLGRVRCVDFSSDGNYFVQGDHRGKAYLYKLAA